MDIAYLLWLQDFRISINDALTPFMEALSFFAINYILFLPAFMYWCISKRKGLFIFFALRIAQTINTTIKLIACVYRPWIRDARIIPAGNAISDATGYSFPSGHSGMSTAICGSMAIFTKKNKMAVLSVHSHISDCHVLTQLSRSSYTSGCHRRLPCWIVRHLHS